MSDAGLHLHMTDTHTHIQFDGLRVCLRVCAWQEEVSCLSVQDVIINLSHAEQKPLKRSLLNDLHHEHNTLHNLNCRNTATLCARRLLYLSLFHIDIFISIFIFVSSQPCTYWSRWAFVYCVDLSWTGFHGTAVKFKIFPHHLCIILNQKNLWYT